MKKLISMCIIMTMLFATVMTTTAFAADDNISPKPEARANVNSFVWDGSDVEFTLTSSNYSKVRYMGIYNTITGSEGAAIFVLTNVSTNITYHMTMVCDGGYYTLQRPLPAGTYKVSLQQYTGTNLVQVTANFMSK